MFCEEGVLRNFAKFTEKHLFQSLFFNKVAGATCNLIKKETLSQVFSCEFCEISKSTFFYRTPLVAASEKSLFITNNEKKTTALLVGLISTCLIKMWTLHTPFLLYYSITTFFSTLTNSLSKQKTQ